mmetsp:Transcript_31612/g.76385  ORF Transcript_31612/g.76385 Transcript_31612/m.76385 type:complete len:214 (-) Transcript_31612:4356-4997(-)
MVLYMVTIRDPWDEKYFTDRIINDGADGRGRVEDLRMKIELQEDLSNLEEYPGREILGGKILSEFFDRHDEHFANMGKFRSIEVRGTGFEEEILGRCCRATDDLRLEEVQEADVRKLFCLGRENHPKILRYSGYALINAERSYYYEMQLALASLLALAPKYMPGLKRLVLAHSHVGFALRGVPAEKFWICGIWTSSATPLSARIIRPRGRMLP